MRGTAQNNDTQDHPGDDFVVFRERISARLSRSLMPVFAGGHSSRAVPTLHGTSFCIEVEGFRFLVTAKHVLDGLQELYVRDRDEQLVPLTDFQRIDLPELDVTLLEISFSHPCKHLLPFFMSTLPNKFPQPSDLLHLEGYSISRNKVPHKKGLVPMGIPVLASSHEPQAHKGRFVLNRKNYTDADELDVNQIPSLQGLSGSPVFSLSQPQRTGDIASAELPDPIGVFTEVNEADQFGFFTDLGVAAKSAVSELLSVGASSQLRKIRILRNEIIDLLDQHHVRKLRIFGSAARHEERNNSDVDMLAEFAPGYDMLRDRVALQQKLTQLFDVEVDLVPEHELNPLMIERVLQEALPL